MNKNLLTIAILSLTSASAFAHTGVRDNVLEGVATYTGYTITHGCADNAGGEGSGNGVDGNSSQQDVIAQSAVFPTDFNTAIIGPVDSYNYFTDTFNFDEMTSTVKPLGKGGVSSSLDVTGGNATGLSNNSGQVATVTWKSGKWAPLATSVDLKSALSVSYVAPSVFPEAYIKRDSTGLFRGYDSWGSMLPEGGGTVGVSNFKVTTPVLNPESCYKGIKIFTGVINYCSTERARQDKNNDRYDVWVGFKQDGMPAIQADVSEPTLVYGGGITSTKVFTNQNLMPNAANTYNLVPNSKPPVAVTDSKGDPLEAIYWSTITVNRVSPMPVGCATDKQVYLGIAPSTEDIDTYLPMAIKTKSHPSNPGKKFEPNSNPQNYNIVYTPRPTPTPTPVP